MVFQGSLFGCFISFYCATGSVRGRRVTHTAHAWWGPSLRGSWHGTGKSRTLACTGCRTHVPLNGMYVGRLLAHTITLCRACVCIHPLHRYTDSVLAPTVCPPLAGVPASLLRVPLGLTHYNLYVGIRVWAEAQSADGDIQWDGDR